jgi:hypothetical protein
VRIVPKTCSSHRSGSYGSTSPTPQNNPSQRNTNVQIRISKLPIHLLFPGLPELQTNPSVCQKSIHYMRCHSNKLLLVEERLIAQSACLHRPICYRHLLRQYRTPFPVSSNAHHIKNTEGNNSIRSISTDDFPPYRTYYIICNAMMTWP